MPASMSLGHRYANRMKAPSAELAQLTKWRTKGREGNECEYRKIPNTDYFSALGSWMMMSR